MTSANVRIPLVIKNGYINTTTNASPKLTLYILSLTGVSGITFTITVDGNATYSSSVGNTTEFIFGNSQVYIFYYDYDAKNYGLFQTVKVSIPNTLNLTLINTCKNTLSISVVDSTPIQLGYISNNINSYVKATGDCTNDPNGCFWNGSSPNCICIDTDQLQDDINAGLIFCPGTTPNKPGTPNPPTGSNPGTPTPPPADDGISIWWWITIGILAVVFFIVIIAIISYLVSKNKKKTIPDKDGKSTDGDDKDNK